MKKISVFNLIEIHLYRGKKINKNYKKYINDYKLFCSQLNKRDFEITNNKPCLLDKNDDAGVASGHYFLQDLYVAQQIYQNNPRKHVDVGSRIDGFVAHVASFREIEVFDIRPLKTTVSNIVFHQMDLTSPPVNYYNYCDSISCLHALEHFGLGRYGDTLDINGHIKGLENISKILKPEGLFYLSVPISSIQRIEFNAHRIFCIPYLLNLFKSFFSVLSISYIDDQGLLHQSIEADDLQLQDSFNCSYGCVIFTLKKNTNV